MALNLQGISLIRKFFEVNTSFFIKSRVINGKEEVTATLNEGVAFCKEIENCKHRCFVMKTFINYDMRKMDQEPGFLESELQRIYEDMRFKEEISKNHNLLSKYREIPITVWGKSPCFGKTHAYLCNVNKKIEKPINHRNMKKIVFLSLFTLCLPLAMMAQSNDDDLYFIPSKDKEKEVKAPVKKAPEKRQVTTTVYTAPGTTVVVQDKKGNTRDVDEYNRRYDSRDNEFAMENDTLLIKEKAQPGLDGEWVNGEFNGSQDDYEYAERIIRFRNPRYAISISSPFYWDVMYGANSWDWNVYSDGLYAYAFPTFSNRLWWDWRFNSYGGGWGFGFGSPYYGWGGYPGYWGGGYGGWYGGGWGGHWGHHHHGGGYYPGWGGGHSNSGYWARNSYYNDRRSVGSSAGGRDNNYSTSRRSVYNNGTRTGGSSGSNSSYQSSRRSGSYGGTRTPSRVVGTRPAGERPESTVRPDASSSRRSTYTRPSSTRNSNSTGGSYETSRRSSASGTPSNSSYNRGSSSESRSSSTPQTSRRSYDNSSSSSSRSSSSYSSGSSGSSRSSSYSSGGGSSSRSSGGSSSGGGGSSRRR